MEQMSFDLLSINFMKIYITNPAVKGKILINSIFYRVLSNSENPNNLKNIVIERVDD